MVNAEKRDAKMKKWGRYQLDIAWRLCVASFVFQLSVFSKLCIMNTHLHFLLCYFNYAVVSGTYPWVAVS